MAGEQAPGQDRCLREPSARFGFVTDDHPRADLPFVEGSRAARFPEQTEYEGV